VSKSGKMEKARGAKMQILISLNTNLDCVITRVELGN